MNDTKLVKAIKAHIEDLEKSRIPQAQGELLRSTNERAMFAQYWTGTIATLKTEAAWLKALLGEK